MSYTVSLQQRIQQMKKAQADLPNILVKAQRGAAQRAVDAAMDATPPKAGTGRLGGTNTLTGELKQHWATDSKIEPVIQGKRLVSELANDKEYASFVDQGHRMDKHFVPGLYVNPESGLLEYDPTAKVGLVVGTKTKYVKGEFMVGKAKEAYEKAVLADLDKEIRRVLR